MRFPGLEKFRVASRAFRSRFVHGAIILGYHRIAELPSDPFSLCVTPLHFDEHLQVLRRFGHLISLRELIRARDEENLPRRTIVVTFDDGYADNLHTAKALLERYETPATFFIATGQIGRNQEFWWDELERVLLSGSKLPQKLVLTINGKARRWDTGEASFGMTFSSLGANRSSKRQGVADPTRSLLHVIYSLFRSSSDGECQELMRQIRAWVGLKSNTRSTHVTLSNQELVHLAKGKLVEIGSHTVTHPSLAKLPLDEQRYEIEASKTWLENLLGRPVVSFSYPHGSLTPETVSLVRAAGFACACSSFTDVAWRMSDRFRLPRMWVPDCDGITFSHWLQRWLHD